MINASTEYALVLKATKQVIQKGSKKMITKLKNQKGSEYEIYNSPRTVAGDYVA